MAKPAPTISQHNGRRADDQRIDRLTQEAYAKGYLKPSDFTAVAAKMVATVIKNERVTGKGCKG